MTKAKRDKPKDVDVHCNGHRTNQGKHSDDNKSATKQQSYHHLRPFLSAAVFLTLVAILLAFYHGIDRFDPRVATPSPPASSPPSSKVPKVAPPTTTKSKKLSKPDKKLSAINTNATLLVEKMITFLDELVEMQLDDFVTVENPPDTRLREILRFNNLQILPRLASIVKMDLFKYVKFNLQRPCTLWHDSFSCTKMSCNIKFCSQSELPQTYLDFDSQSCPSDSPSALSQLDKTMSKDSVEALNVLFECSRDDTNEAQYYDLVRNPERYTGYDGHLIWRAIYEENCFVTRSATDTDIFALNKTCYEERMFYRSISGLHSSITTHLLSIYLRGGANQFGPNAREYARRFLGQSEWLKNLFFVYLIELNALYKAEPYLMNKINWNASGPEAVGGHERQSTREAIKDLLKSQQAFQWHFDENILFKNQPKALAEQISSHFHNITFNIMDCVSCDKCRLWGKVQTNGLGTAFKILLTKDVANGLRLSHHEVTCLLNGLARLSYSISQISNFQQIFEEMLLAEDIQDEVVEAAATRPKVFF